MGHTVESLIAFEERVRQAFLAGAIRAPVHLSGGNEAALLGLFAAVEPADWVFSTWRSHLHALLHGMPEELVFAQILAGKSMHLESLEHRLVCSSIVGGILPIACGVAAGIRRAGGTERVWVCVGDMAATTGLYSEVYRYCCGHNLPVGIIIEDNGLSTNTPTVSVWGAGKGEAVSVARYQYDRKHPHVGVGRWVDF